MKNVAVCIASGPSLNVEHIEIVRMFDVFTITVNSSWMIMPDCNVIYAGDYKWWVENYYCIDSPAEKWSCSHQAVDEFDLNYHCATGAYNSGLRAIQFAISLGFFEVILLGYDCSLGNGVHWHGEHQSLRNPTNKSIQMWQRQFMSLSANLKERGVNVFNCSPSSKLSCFEKKNLYNTLTYLIF